MTTIQSPVTTVRMLLAEGLALGEARTAASLTLLPVRGTWAAPSYLTAAQAFARGTLSIGEVDGGRVPQLVVQNRGDLPVLLLDGEHLEGAMQNRVLNVSVLAAARHDTVIPVSCVERGRWGYDGSAPDLSPSAYHAHTELRAMNLESASLATRLARPRTSDQGAVWAHLERKREQMGSGASRTGSMADAYRARGADLESIAAAFDAPEPTQTGVLAVAAGRVLALDLFDRADTLASVWARLVRGYAVDALTAPADVRSDGNVQAARTFLDGLGQPDLEATSHEGVGLGIDVIVTSPGALVTALTWGTAVVHLAAFARVPAGRPGDGRPPARTDRTERPANRARARTARWFHEGGDEG